MNARMQLFLSLLLVAFASVLVGIYSFVIPSGEATGDAAGHNHVAAVGDDGLSPVRLDAASARRIGITYATVERRPLARTVSTVGVVTYDETRLFNVNPKIEGWVERLYVDFTGASLRAGQPLLEIYSPMLVSAQEELILARRLVDQAASGRSERAAANARDLLEAARQRLHYWDVPEEEIERIERTLSPRKTITLTAAASGVVIEKNVVQGSRIMPGMDLYKIADLTRVWINGEVFEKDLSLVRLGQRAQVTFEAYPGEVFRGVVTYVYPTVSLEARTGQIRLELANPGLKLMPGMYAQVEIASVAPGEVLLIPRSAVLLTGLRTLVFVREPDGTLTPREIQTGLAAENDIEVLSGLTAGEVVVTSANFLIDAESNLGASMDAMPGMNTGAPTGAVQEDQQARRPLDMPMPVPGPQSPADQAGHKH